MNKALFIERVRKSTGMTQNEAAEAVEAVLDTMVRVVAEGGNVSITGFGTLTSKEWPARWARNPQTGERVRVKKVVRPKFLPGANFSELVAGNKKLPKTGSAITKAAKGSVAAQKAKEAERAERREALRAERAALKAIVEGTK
jgi:DNA-binding protein HU-beta